MRNHSWSYRNSAACPRITSLENDLVPAEQSGHRMRIVNRAVFEVDDTVEGEGAGHARDRIDADFLDMPLRASSSRTRSCRSSGCPLAWYAYGLATPCRKCARPCASNSIGNS